MSFRETMNQMNQWLSAITKDLVKVNKGNKAAAQRVRTGTIQLEKVAKSFRKESVIAEKSGQLKHKFQNRKKAVKKFRKKR